ncbi:MAG TPA: sulfotransferase domain-containing protein [Caulobacter sp.]|nr:sulfotransferase domain-containing protein [Caulobacter sp.]
MPGLPPIIRKPAAKVWRERIRPWTRRFDGKPDFLIIGAQKAGTTWLTFLLTQQASMLKPKVKEVHYFNKFYDLGGRWYRSNFATSADAAERARETGVPRQLRYEATPDYLFDTEVPARIAADLPGVRLVVLVRDPVWRAVSAYRHMIRHGLETRSLEDAILGEEAHLEQAWKTSPAAGRQALEYHSYVARGRYFEQIERYRRLFPAQDIHVMVYEDFVADPQAALVELSRFLDAPMVMPQRTDAQNVGDYERQIEPHIERHIRRATEADTISLFEMLNRPRPW